MSILYAKLDKMCGIDCRKFDHVSLYSCDGSRCLIQRAMFRARITDFMMRKNSVSTLFIMAVHLQVLVCMRLQCLLGLRENLARSDYDVLSLMVNNI